MLENEINLYNDLHEYLQYRNNCFRYHLEYTSNTYYDKIINSRYAKISRIKKRLLYIISHRNYCYFVTFTFDDELILKCDRTKLDKIKNCLKSFSDDILIMMNRDFGKKNDREHFHCIVGTNSSDDLLSFVANNYQCRSKVQKIHKSCNDIKKLSKYINKLINHCVKDTTHKFRMYYNFKGFDNLDPIYYYIQCFKYGLK